MLYDPKWEVKVAPQEKWRATLLAAADLVRRRGLAKDTQVNTRGAVCLHGAISIAATGKPYCLNDQPEYCRAGLAVHAILSKRGVDGRLTTKGGSAMWNNQPERTAEEVIEVLESAARS